MWGLGFRVKSLMFGFESLGFGIWGSGVLGLRFGIWGLGVRFWGLGFGISSVGARGQGYRGTSLARNRHPP